jgi:hypothetical protein
MSAMLQAAASHTRLPGALAELLPRLKLTGRKELIHLFIYSIDLVRDKHTYDKLNAL